jgi:hypothetical protein
MARAAIKSIEPSPAVLPASAHDPLAVRRRALRIGKDILGLLDDLHMSVRASHAAEQISSADLADLEDAEASLKAVLGEIELRAYSERAKLGRERH